MAWEGGCMKAFRVKDWGEIFENNRSRSVTELRWVPVPNKFDGEGYRRVMRHERASEIFTAFILILEVASRCQPRGTLIRNGRPIDAESLALKTSGRREWFELAVEVLSTPEIGWIESFDIPESQPDARRCQQSVTRPSPARQSPDGQVPRMEGKGMEGEGAPPAGKLSAADTVKFDGELKRVTRELEKLGPLENYDKGTRKHNRILELTTRQKELRTVLGVTA